MRLELPEIPQEEISQQPKEISPEQVIRNEHYQKWKQKLQIAIIIRHMEEHPREDPVQWADTFSAKFGEIVDRNHHYVPDFEASMDKPPEVQEALLQKIEKELYVDLPRF